MAKNIAEAKEEDRVIGKQMLQLPLSQESIINIPENAEFLITKNYEGDSNKVRIDITLTDRGKSFYFIIEKNYEGDPNKIKIIKAV